MTGLTGQNRQTVVPVRAKVGQAFASPGSEVLQTGLRQPGRLTDVRVQGTRLSQTSKPGSDYPHCIKTDETMSNKDRRQIENELKQLLWDAGRERFPYPRYISSVGFYPVPVALLATKEPRWLYFLDCLFGQMDEQGAIEISFDRILARGGIKERTLRNYLHKLTNTGWVISWEQWLLQRADEQLKGMGWELLSRESRRRHVQNVARPEKRTRIYLVTEKFGQSELLYKPRTYLLRGWSDYRRDLAARQVINGLFWGFNQKQKHTVGPLSSFEMSRWELRSWTKKVHGQRIPEEFRAALAAWLEDGLLLREGESRFRFELARINRKAPGETPADWRYRLRRDIQRKLGLDAQAEKEKITLLANLIERKIIREREVKTFLNVLERYHPFLLHERQFKKLIDWMIAQYDSGRRPPAWKELLQDYLAAEVRKKPVLLGEWLFRFAQRTADGDVFLWQKKTPMTGLILRWRLQPKNQKGKAISVIRTAMLRQAKVFLPEDDGRPSRRFYQTSDVSAFLKRLKDGESLVVFSVVDHKNAEIWVEVALLGHPQ